MSTPLLTRFSLRLLVPVLALGAIAALGEPLPAPAAPMLADAELAVADAGLSQALQHEAELLRQEAEAAKKTARQTASQMRWFLTLPAASRRCSSPGCTS